MKKIISIFILSFIALSGVIGCAKIEFTDAQGNTATYHRVGRTDLKDIEYRNGDVKLKVGSAKGDSGQLGEALKNTSEAALNISKTLAAPGY